MMTMESSPAKRTPPAPPELMTLREAADALAVDYDTVLRWAQKGVFGRVVRVGPSGAMRLYRVDVMGQRREK